MWLLGTSISQNYLKLLVFEFNISSFSGIKMIQLDNLKPFNNI
jgi:hypothetical protein